MNRTNVEIRRAKGDLLSTHCWKILDVNTCIFIEQDAYISLEGEDYIFCVKYAGAHFGEAHTSYRMDVAFISDELDHYRTNVLYCQQCCITKSSGTLYNFVFHISCSTCTSSVPYIYVALHLSVYYIYTCYIYTHSYLNVYICTVPILFYLLSLTIH